MAKCSYCGARKGKRRCPALDGLVCSQCCGAHRLAEIDCPPKCSWLGGLQAVADPEYTKEIPQEVWEETLDMLFVELGKGYGSSYMGTAFEDFELDEEPEEWEAEVLLSYACLALRDPSGQRFVDRFLEAHGRDLSPQHVATLKALQESWVSLFRIVAVNEGVGLELENLVDGERWVVQETALTSMVEADDHLFAWIGQRGDHMELTAGSILVPEPYQSAVRDELIEAIEREREAQPGVPDGVLAAQLAWLPVRTLKELHTELPPFLQDFDEDDDMDGELQEELVGAALRSHYETWIDEPLPALDGKTPREASKRKADRSTLQGLVDEIELRTREMPGGYTVDFATMREQLKLPASPKAISGYDPAQAPEARTWLAMDELERIDLVEAHHEGESPQDDELENSRLHASFHTVVENQIAAGDPPEVAATVERLMHAGASRHEAVHAASSVVAKMFYRLAAENKEFDVDGLVSELDAIDPEDWIGTAPQD